LGVDESRADEASLGVDESRVRPTNQALDFGASSTRLAGKCTNYSTHTNIAQGSAPNYSKQNLDKDFML
jgi:hypothetical protein